MFYKQIFLKKALYLKQTNQIDPIPTITWLHYHPDKTHSGPKNPLLNGWSLPKFLRIIPKHNCQFLIKKTELDEKWVSILAN